MKPRVFCMAFPFVCFFILKNRVNLSNPFFPNFFVCLNRFLSISSSYMIFFSTMCIYIVLHTKRKNTFNGLIFCIRWFAFPWKLRDLFNWNVAEFALEKEGWSVGVKISCYSLPSTWVLFSTNLHWPESYCLHREGGSTYILHVYSSPLRFVNC